jgi:hypothetical protein
MASLFEAISARVERGIEDARAALSLPPEEARHFFDRAAETLQLSVSQFQLMQGHLSVAEKNAIVRQAEELRQTLELLRSRAERAHL